MLAKYIVKHARLPKSSERFTKLIDNPGKEYSAKELACNIDWPKIMKSSFRSKPRQKSDHRVDLMTERLKKLYLEEEPLSRISEGGIEDIVKEMKLLEKKKKNGTLTAQDKFNLNLMSRCVKKDFKKHTYESRWDMPETDDASAGLRSNEKSLYNKLDKLIEEPFGSELIKQGLATGRKYRWQGCVIKMRNVIELKTFKEAFDAASRIENLLPCWRTFVLLEKLKCHDLNLLNTFYGARKQQDWQWLTQKTDTLQEIYHNVKDKSVEHYSGYLGSKDNLFQYLEAGLKIYGIIQGT